MTDCIACNGSGMKSVDANWSRTCKHCNGSGLAYGAPHAIDYDAYRNGVSRPQAMLYLEASDPFWKTLGGNVSDPWGDGGEHVRQRMAAIKLGIGDNIYSDMYHG